MSQNDPTVIFFGHGTADVADFARLGLACRFYGFKLLPFTFDEAALSPSGREATETNPVLVVISGEELTKVSAGQMPTIQAAAERYGAPIAVVGITPDCSYDTLTAFTPGFKVGSVNTGPSSSLWVKAPEPSCPGFELRGLPLGLSKGSSCWFESQAQHEVRVLVTLGLTESASEPVMLQICHAGQIRYLVTRIGDGSEDTPWAYRQSSFGEIAPSLLMLRHVGGHRCWHPSTPLANLTIDDPYLREPYGRLSFPGLLEQMRLKRFHATIGFVPWNFDRNAADVVALFAANPGHYSIAVHGNNHDRYEFFRYAAHPGDQQRAKRLEVQDFNIRQGLARMEAFHHCTGLPFDRVMVFPHGVCPAETFGVLKRHGFWATSNYSNVPLDEKPPTDPAVAMRGVNTQWAGFPAMRRNYPQNYSNEAIAIDLFLGNPVLFMAHQDLFFDGIDAFNCHASRVNERQPGVKWLSLGEISRRIHLLRWRSDAECEVRLIARHAIIDNSRPTAVNFVFSRDEPDPELVDQVTIDGTVIPFDVENGRVTFATSLSAHASSLVEIHYRSPGETSPVAIARRGFRYRSLRAIADFRDITFSRSRFGRLLTRKYYGQGKRRPTLSGMITKLRSYLRRSG